MVADLAYRQQEDLDEGKLTDLRKAIVNADALARVAEELGVGDALLLGKGEAAAGGRQKRSILSDAFEAIIGAVYLDGGASAGYGFVERLLGSRILSTVGVLGGLDHKTALQELAVKLFESPPVYRLIWNDARFVPATPVDRGEVRACQCSSLASILPRRAAHPTDGTNRRRAVCGGCHND